MKQILIILIWVCSLSSLQAAATKYQSNAHDKIETIYLAGGCFWGMQQLLRDQPGVTATEVGYMGDISNNVTYELVKTGKTNFAETVQVKFDKTKIHLKDILKYFFKIHDPTTRNQQGHDKGKQYRSAIFYESLEQKNIAEGLIKNLNDKKIFKGKITTEVTTALKWNKAESYHQDYLQKNPDGYTCHFERNLNF